MSVSDVVVIALGVLVYFTFSKLPRLIREQNLAVNGDMETLRKQLERLEEKLSAIEYNTLSQTEKECRVFQQARDLTLSELRAVKQGETLHLITKSYFYPSEQPFVETFEYKHDQVDEGGSSKFGYEVHGFRRSSAARGLGALSIPSVGKGIEYLELRRNGKAPKVKAGYGWRFLDFSVSRAHGLVEPRFECGYHGSFGRSYRRVKTRSHPEQGS